MAKTSRASSPGFDLRVLSLGAGVQSTAMYLMALDGELPHTPDVAIFADTQQEPPWVYENLWRLAVEGGDRIPIRVATAGDLGSAVLRKCGKETGRFASVPFWTDTNGKRGAGRRHCTRDYKIRVVTREIRRAIGLRPRQSVGGLAVEEWVGISLDEATRAKPSRQKWITTRWPLLLDKPMRRYQIRDWLIGRGWPTVRRSACVFCPYRSPRELAQWRKEAPEQFEAACRWDEIIRDGGVGLEGKQYMVDTLVPLRELPTVEEMKANKQPDLFDLFENECEGMCGL